MLLQADGATFSATDLTIGIEVPCNASTATVIAQIDLVDPGDGSALASPPSASITIPSLIDCGSVTSLTASVSDPDLAEVRRFVDEVLLAPGTTSVTFTEAHELKLVARDARGAATTDRRNIQCL